MRLRTSKLFGGKIVNVPLKERKGVLDETRWYFDPKELENRITDKSKLFSFCNPNNPTGFVYSKDDLNAIARIAKEHDLFVLTNECYERFVWTSQFFDTLIFDSLAAMNGMKERTFTLQGITKAYETEGNMTVGWCNGPSEYISILKWLQFTSCQKWGTALGGYMGMAVLTTPFREEYVRQQWKIYTMERDMLWETLNQFSWIECGKAKGGPFMFPDVSGCGMSDAQLAEFLRKRGVGVGSGTAWAEDPQCGAGHMRLSYCSPMELQKNMVRELEETLLEYEVLHKDLIVT
jgi:aspartate/methionine/tyrosine aminotransferase